MLQKSCEFIARCNNEHQDVKVAVNVAAKQLANPGFADEVAEIIRSTGIEASSLELEVTESALMHDFEQTRDILIALTSLGVTIALGCHLGQGYFMCRPVAMNDFFIQFISNEKVV